MTIENWTIEEQTGYKPQTTFYTDFSIADRFGVNAIKDTFKQAFEEWKSNVIYMTELTMVLNWKCWRWYEHNNTLCKLYTDLYHQAAAYCENNFTGDDLSYYYQTTD